MTCCGGQVVCDAAMVREQSVNEKLQEEELRSVSRSVEGDLLETSFVVPDMHCVACISKIERGLSDLAQVEKARANLSTRRVSVIWDAKKGWGRDIVKALSKLGFDHSLYAGEDDLGKRVSDTGRQLLLSLAVAGFATANIMLLSVSVWSGADAETAKLFHLISGLIAVPAVAFAGRPFFGSALQALSARRLNMDVPISLAVLLALGMGLFESLNGGSEAYFDACVMLLFFLLIGRYLDNMMRERARSSVQGLAKLTSKGGAAVQSDGSLEYVAQADIKSGITLRVLPGERFPVDGRIVSGTTDVDRSLVTGESESVLAKPGDTLEAGVLNLTGSIDVIATSSADSSFLAEIMKMMQAAENGRGHYVRLAERMARIYAPAVHLLALITFVGWMVASSGDWKTSIYVAIAVLIITCPCALGLAVPVVHVIGANRLFKAGILMRDGGAFERLSDIDTAVFDKTGTLTLGEPQLLQTLNADPVHASLIAAIAGHSSHPAARALAREHSASAAADLDNPTEVPGYGIEAEYQGRKIRLGRPRWVAELAVCASETDNSMTMAFAVENESMTGFRLADSLRRDAREAVQELRQRDVIVEIMSGDRNEAVASVAKELSVQRHRHDLTPKDKIDELNRLDADGRKVLMMGDGLNDAPALAAAHVSMAPASASEVGRLASDFVFTRNTLLSVPFAHAIARRTTRLIKQNFGLAIAYNCMAVPLAMAGYVTPLIAAIAMSASSIVVVANSMRLNWYRAGSIHGISPIERKKRPDAMRADQKPAHTTLQAARL